MKRKMYAKNIVYINLMKFTHFLSMVVSFYNGYIFINTRKRTKKLFQWSECVFRFPHFFSLQFSALTIMLWYSISFVYKKKKKYSNSFSTLKEEIKPGLSRWPFIVIYSLLFVHFPSHDYIYRSISDELHTLYFREMDEMAKITIFSVFFFLHFWRCCLQNCDAYNEYRAVEKCARWVAI